MFSFILFLLNWSAIHFGSLALKGLESGIPLLPWELQQELVFI